MMRQIIPEDLNVEVLLNNLEQNKLKIKFQGKHKRNSCNDIKNFETIKKTEEDESQVQYDIELTRNSIYNILPEYLFHRLDRFEHLQRNDDEFSEQYQEQCKEISNARNFFYPVDLALLKLKCDIRDIFDRYSRNDLILQNIFSDELTQKQKSNRFIINTLPFLITSRIIRGNRTLLTLLLRKVFSKEDLVIRVHNKQYHFEDKVPQYDCCVDDSTEKLFLGNRFEQDILSYDIIYWPGNFSNEDFDAFLKDVETYRIFIESYFISVEAILYFNIITDKDKIILSDQLAPSFLGYNSNL